MTSTADALKLFVITNQLLEHDLDRVEQQYAVDLGREHRHTVQADEAYYPQIEAAIRAEAARMAPHYEVFYSLENTIRELIAGQLEAAEGDGWWLGPRVMPKIRSDAEDRRQREVDTGITPRSDEPLDFVNFGELNELIKSNWDVFGAMFSSSKAVERVLAQLNTLRASIAHCAPLAEDEVVRLRLTVKAWFRLME
jgi:hypothetical protein